MGKNPERRGQRIGDGGSLVIRRWRIIRGRHIVGRRSGGPAHIRGFHRFVFRTTAPLHCSRIPGTSWHPDPAVALGGHPVAVMVSGPPPGFLGLEDIAVVGGNPAAVGIGPPVLRDLVRTPHRPILFVVHPLPVLGQVVVKHSHIFGCGADCTDEAGTQDQGARQGQDCHEPRRLSVCFHCGSPQRVYGVHIIRRRVGPASHYDKNHLWLPYNREIPHLPSNLGAKLDSHPVAIASTGSHLPPGSGGSSRRYYSWSRVLQYIRRTIVTMY